MLTDKKSYKASIESIYFRLLELSKLCQTS